MPHQRWTAGETRPKLDQFLKPVLRAARLDLDYQISAGGGDQKFITPDLTVSFEGKDVDLLLAHKGELLLAIEHLCLEAMGVSHADRYRVIFDARDYRIMRIDELCLSTCGQKQNIYIRQIHDSDGGQYETFTDFCGYRGQGGNCQDRSHQTVCQIIQGKFPR